MSDTVPASPESERRDLVTAAIDAIDAATDFQIVDRDTAAGLLAGLEESGKLTQAEWTRVLSQYEPDERLPGGGLWLSGPSADGPER